MYVYVNCFWCFPVRLFSVRTMTLLSKDVQSVAFLGVPMLPPGTGALHRSGALVGWEPMFLIYDVD